MMDDPYRETVAADVLIAQTRMGEARLEIAPHHAVLTVGVSLRLVATKDEVKVTRTIPRKKRKPKTVEKTLRRGEHTLLVAQRFQTEDVSLWYSLSDGHFERWFGIEPVALLDAQALREWRNLEQIRERLFDALRGEDETATFATEFGQGRNHAIVIDYPDRAEVWAKPFMSGAFPGFFRESPTKLFEVYREGFVVRFKNGKEIGRSKYNSQFAVTIAGDRIRFSTPLGEDGESLFLPWVAPEEREELKHRFAEYFANPSQQVA